MAVARVVTFLDSLRDVIVRFHLLIQQQITLQKTRNDTHTSQKTISEIHLSVKPLKRNINHSLGTLSWSQNKFGKDRPSPHTVVRKSRSYNTIKSPLLSAILKVKNKGRGNYRFKTIQRAFFFDEGLQIRGNFTLRDVLELGNRSIIDDVDNPNRVTLLSLGQIPEKMLRNQTD